MSDRPVLRRGSSGQAVAVWQRAIGITADGIFGRQTEAATKAWQSRHDLEPDGVVGPLSWATVVAPGAPIERRVETVQTPLTMTDLARGLLEAWPEIERSQAGVLWAQFAIETGDGRHCYNYNLGNVKHVPGDGHNYVHLEGVWEGVTPETARKLIATGQWEIDTSPDHVHAVAGGKVAIRATGSNPGTWFRAYESLEKGARAFVEMKRRPESHYHPAWQYVLSGDPENYARTLGSLGYFTASAEVYARGMRAKFDAWLRSRAFDAARMALANT